MVNYCKKCVQPDTRPGLYFNEESVCSACLYMEDVDKNIDWSEREKELKEIVKWAKANTKSAYDCVIGVSGGKDSTVQALYSRDRLGLRVLLVNNEPEGITEAGRHNIENLTNLGFDVIKMRPNPKILKKMMLRDFYKYLNPIKITEYSLWSSTYIIAKQFQVPLIIQGENPMLTMGGNEDVEADGDSLNANRLNTLSEDWREYIGDSIEEKDLFFYHYDRDELINLGIKGVWLGYYMREWSPSNNVEFSMKHGLMIREDFNPEDIGTYVGYYQMDSDAVQVNQLLKYIKFGFGQCTDHACYDIRTGKITRQEAIELVRKYDGKCSDKYIKSFCDYLGITPEEFWRVADSFRGPMWKKDPDGNWKLKKPIWEQVKTAV